MDYYSVCLIKKTMFAELILSYFLISNDPMYLRSAERPYTKMSVSLEVHKPITDRLSLRLAPYVFRSLNQAGRAGAEAEIMYRFDDLKIGIYHHSSHNLDVPGDALEVDGIRMRWKLK